MKVQFLNYWDSSHELEWNISWQIGDPKICTADFDPSKGSHWGFRFGTHQLALWKNHKAIFDIKLQDRSPNRWPDGPYWQKHTK